MTDKTRSYPMDDTVAIFHKTKEKWGGLSNMAGGYPISCVGFRCFSSEALYQALKLPDRSDVQTAILADKNAFTSKLKAKTCVSEHRADWDAIRVDVMRWVIKCKLICNEERFGKLLLDTGDRYIVERSHKDTFWGTVPQLDRLVGRNILGRLLMELRACYQEALAREAAGGARADDPFWSMQPSFEVKLVDKILTAEEFMRC